MDREQARMVFGLLRAKWWGMRNIARSTGREKQRVAVFGAMGALMWCVVFAGAYWFIGRCLSLDVIGGLLVEKILDLTSLILLSMLVFSGVVNAFSSFLLSEDLDMIVPQPLPSEVVYTARFVEAAVVSGWMPVLFALPVFVAAGVHVGAGPMFYGATVLGMLALVGVATAVATIGVLALTTVLPAHKTRDVLVFAGVVVGVVLFVVARAMSPDAWLDPSKFQSTMELFAGLEGPSLPYLPSAWWFEVLRGVLRGEGVDGMRAGALVWTAGGLFFVGSWVFRGCHSRAFSKARQGKPWGGDGERVMVHRTDQERGGSGLRGVLDPRRELGVKDAKVFVRDPAQWTQMVLMGSMMVLYVLNMRSFQGVGESGLVGPLGLYVMNTGLCGFVVSAIGLRFLFPAVSLEGRAFWLLRTAPVEMRVVLESKARTGFFFLMCIGLPIALVSNALIGMPWWMSVQSVVCVSGLSWFVSGLGVGLGAMYPRFDITNAAKIASGFGGMVYMTVGLLWVIATAAVMASPSWLFLQWSRVDVFDPVWAGVSTCLIGVWVGFTVWIPRALLRKGAKEMGSERVEV